MQLIDRGDAILDDPTLITDFLPELAAQKVLTGYTNNVDGTKEWHFEPQTSTITPRMLLNHTYGGGHTYFNTLLFEYFSEKGIWTKVNEATDTYATLLALPLLWQPGPRTNYGQGLDWIAVLVERIMHQDLASYLQDHIFTPLSLHSMGYEPGFGGDVLSRPGNKGRFWPRKLRTETGVLDIDPLEPERIEHHDAFPKGAYHTGRLGTGLVASAADYARLLTIFLPENNGVDSVTGYRLICPEAVHEITSPQLAPHLRNYSRNVPASGASPIILPGILGAAHRDPEGSFGLVCGVQGVDRELESGARGRSKGSVYWYGAANTEYWVDMEKGIAVFVNGNYYPWNEEAWGTFVAGVERMIYQGLSG